MHGKQTLAIIPAYNEEQNVGRVIESLKKHDPDLDIVVIDDGSRERTSEVARTNGAIAIRLPHNLGIGGAVQTGLIYAVPDGSSGGRRRAAQARRDPDYPDTGAKRRNGRGDRFTISGDQELQDHCSPQAGDIHLQDRAFPCETENLITRPFGSATQSEARSEILELPDSPQRK